MQTWLGLILMACIAVPLGCSREPDAKTLEEITAAILARSATESESVPDRQLLKADSIIVREEVGNPLQGKVTAAALGGRANWKIKSEAAIQRDAEAADTQQYFVVFEEIQVGGNKAVVKWGTDILIPAREKKTTMILCCSIATDEYRKDRGSWSFVKRLEEIAPTDGNALQGTGCNKSRLLAC